MPYLAGLIDRLLMVRWSSIDADTVRAVEREMVEAHARLARPIVYLGLIA